MRRAFLACVLFIAGAAMAAGQSPQAFVQRFYDLYLPASASGWDQAFKSPALRVFLEPGLARALRADTEAQAKVSNDIVGLDFDPFLNSQDPARRYVADQALPAPGGWRVKVFAVEGRRRRPALVVDVAARGPGWVITNLRYPDGSDVLGDLAQARAGRAHARP